MSQVKSKSSTQSRTNIKNQDENHLQGETEKKAKVHRSKHQASKENESNINNATNGTEESHSNNSKSSKERNSKSGHTRRHRTEGGKSSTSRKKTKKSPTKTNEQQPSNAASNDDKDSNKSSSKKSSKPSEVVSLEPQNSKEPNLKPKKTKSTKANSRSSRSSKSKSSLSNGAISNSSFDDFDIVSMTSDDGTSISPRTRLLLLRKKHRDKKQSAKRAIGRAEKREHMFILRPLKQSSVIQQQEQKLQSPKPLNISNETNQSNPTERAINTQLNKDFEEVPDIQQSKNVNINENEQENKQFENQENNQNDNENDIINQDDNEIEIQNKESNNDIDNKVDFEEEEEEEIVSAPISDEIQNSGENDNNHNEEEEENENEIENNNNKNSRKSVHTPDSHSPSRSSQHAKQFTFHTFTDESIVSDDIEVKEDSNEYYSNVIENSEVVIQPLKNSNSPNEKGVLIDLSQSYSQSGNGSRRGNIKKSSSSPIRRSEHRSKKKKRNETDEGFNSGKKANQLNKSKSAYSDDEYFQSDEIDFDTSKKNKNKLSNKNKNKSGKGKSNEKRNVNKNEVIIEEPSFDLHTIEGAPATQTMADNSEFNTIGLIFDKNPNQTEQLYEEKKPNYEFATMDLQFDSVDQINDNDYNNDGDSQLNDDTQTIQNIKQRQINIEDSLSGRSFTYEYETIGYTETDGSTTYTIIEDSFNNSDEFKTKPTVIDNNNLRTKSNDIANNQNEYSFQSDYDSYSHTYTYVSEYVIDEDEKEEKPEEKEYEYEYEYEYETIDVDSIKRKAPENKQTISTRKSPQKQNQKITNKQNGKSSKPKQKSQKKLSFTKPTLETFQDVTIAPFYQSAEDESDHLSEELSSNSDLDNTPQRIARDINIFESSTNTNENNNEYSSLKSIQESNSNIKSSKISNNGSNIKSSKSSKNGSIIKSSKSNNNDSIIKSSKDSNNDITIKSSKDSNHDSLISNHNIEDSIIKSPKNSKNNSSIISNKEIKKDISTKSSNKTENENSQNEINESSIIKSGKNDNKDVEFSESKISNENSAVEPSSKNDINEYSSLNSINKNDSNVDKSINDLEYSTDEATADKKESDIDNLQTNNKATNDEEQNNDEEQTNDEEQNNDEQQNNDDNESSFDSSFDLAPSKKIQEMKKELARLLNNRQKDLLPERANKINDNSSIPQTRNIAQKQIENDDSPKQSESESKNQETKEESSYILESDTTINSQVQENINNNAPQPTSSEIVDTFKEDNENSSSTQSQPVEDKSFSGLLEDLQGVSSGTSFPPEQSDNNDFSRIVPSGINEQSQDYSNIQIFSSVIDNQHEREIKIESETESTNEIKNLEDHSNLNDDEFKVINLNNIEQDEKDNQDNIEQEYEYFEEEEEEFENETETEIKPNEYKIESEEKPSQNQIQVHELDQDQISNPIQTQLQNPNQIQDHNILSYQRENEIEEEINEDEVEEDDYEEEDIQNNQAIQEKTIEEDIQEGEEIEEEERDVQICCIKLEDLPGIKANMFPPFKFKKKSSYDDSDDSDDDSYDFDHTYDQNSSKKKSIFTNEKELTQSKGTKKSKYPITLLNVCILEAHLQTAVSSFVQLGVRENVKGSPSKVNEEETVMTKVVHSTFLPRYNERFNVPIEDVETDELSLKIFSVSNSAASPKPSIVSQVYIATNRFPLNQEITKTYKMTPTGEITLKVTAQSELYNRQHPKVVKEQERPINNNNNEQKQKDQNNEKPKSEEKDEYVQIEFGDDEDNGDIVNENPVENDNTTNTTENKNNEIEDEQYTIEDNQNINEDNEDKIEDNEDNENIIEDNEDNENIIEDNEDSENIIEDNENKKDVDDEDIEEEFHQILAPNNEDIKDDNDDEDDEDIEIQLDLAKVPKTNNDDKITKDSPKYDDFDFNTDDDVVVDEDEDIPNNAYAEPEMANLQAFIEQESDDGF